MSEIETDSHERRGIAGRGYCDEYDEAPGVLENECVEFGVTTEGQG